MKATSVRYERLYNVGNYEHVKFGVELTVDEGEKASDVMEAARKFVRKMNTEAMDERMRKVERARAVLADKANRLVREVSEAQQVIDLWEAEQSENCPF